MTMQIQIGYDIVFNCPEPTPMALMLYVHPDRAGDLIAPEFLRTEPAVPVNNSLDHFGNRLARLVAPKGHFRVLNNAIIRDSGLPEPVNYAAHQLPPELLPDDTLQFLLASRYCEVDRMADIAWTLFGKSPPGWGRVQAVCDWLYTNVQFGYQFARNTKTAYETFVERTAVCRDFMHLACTFCRCLNIPARYATGYLGDIGVPIDPNPMDFSAFFEVYLGGQWWPFDARHNTRRIGRVLVGRGRDAADVAITTSFGPTELLKFTVLTQSVIS